ncbi:transcriptional activator of comK gene [Cytobacillus horneckiae]|uniref:BMP family ABC transporter substrate-binding protein n=1 Tax=Cytobacillus horneckiae TaxID=549687 RepID=A0A2N0ZF37_9BACI|nr:BMP family ABC transporter substrate-binding protein [Cytobacillus horneckiae]MBN6887554.1 BMP family ABC transporter substrate-binding protein [Cytobacillus horneckiae]MCM3178613.1 BMP family ABC transporter substrate-binding protein [Cytobacillus horneckiae]MEC1155566.1 BMP family ABC transporter substrate-binding protein [Cytobacillus horneckiae]MED2936885.1 BMP family ABC transporter substrate-binding protein [Cytobacillus horneckiae]PKG28124.1 BMP family ABC transporter substrate-bindi
MQRSIGKFGCLFLCLLLLASCGQAGSTGELKKAGLLVPDTVNDQVWGTKGYKGMLKIQSTYNIDVYYKEGMNTPLVVERAVKEFSQKGVNLIFGNGNEYAEYFNELSSKYPDIHFVSFNGDAKNANTTSLNFEGYAMGFFGGMVAGEMTETNIVGIIAAFEWQPEVKGFYEGVTFQNKDADVKIQYVGHWDDTIRASELMDSLIEMKADVVYPAGDGYNVPVIEKVKEEGLYAIGYVSDQSDLGKSAVLTSTIQHVDVLYELVAEKFNNGELDSGNLSFDFQDEVISLGTYSSEMDQEFINQLNETVENYKATGELPNQ